MAGDWIKVHRSLMDSAVWGDEWLVKLWLWCLMKANHCDASYRGTAVLRGQFITGRNTASDELHVSPSKWYRGIERLVSLGNITIQANSVWTMITVCNYRTYQDTGSDKRTADEQRADSERTADDTTSGQRADTSKNGIREELNNSRINTPPNPQGGIAGDSTNGRQRKPKKQPYRVEEQDYPSGLDTPAFRQSWQEWTLHRIEKGCAMSQLAADKCLAKCLEWGEPRAIAAINHSIANGWQGLFEPDARKGGGTRPLGFDPDPRGTFAAGAAWLASKGIVDDGQ